MVETYRLLSKKRILGQSDLFILFNHGTCMHTCGSEWQLDRFTAGLPPYLIVMQRDEARPSKRQRCLRLADVRLSKNQWDAIDRSLETLKDKKRKSSYRRDAQDLKQATSPYGKLVEAVLLEGKYFAYVNPQVLLYEACSKNEEFAIMIRDSLKSGQEPRVVLYGDGCTPGNPLRPDKGRKVFCVYWTLTCIPSWFRSRENGWFYMAACL